MLRALAFCYGICLLLCTGFLWIARQTPPHAASLMAFVSDRDGQEDIYLMLSNGQSVRRITSNLSYDWYPSWSPDSQHIAFISDRYGSHDLFRYTLKTRETVRLTSLRGIERYPTWSPDGKTIYFVAEGDLGFTGLHQMSWEGEDIKSLYFVEGDIWSPHISPDGENLIFTGQTFPLNNFLSTIRVDGTGLQLIAGRTSWAYFFPKWSPDGSKIAFNSFMGMSNDNIYTLELATQEITRLTTDHSDDRMPSWSPDGSKIAYMSRNYQQRRNQSWEIYVIDADGNNPQAITQHPANDWSPAWSPPISLAWRNWINAAVGLCLIILSRWKKSS